MLKPEDGVDVKAECRQIAAVRWPECVDRVGFDAHRLWIDRLVVQKRGDELVRARLTVELWIERVRMAQDWREPHA